jgi:hypothetical protein
MLNHITLTMAPAYLVVNLREGDMISMVRFCRSRNAAFQHLQDLIIHHDTSTTWWKIVEFDIDQQLDAGNYDVVLRVSWGSSNRVRVIGVFQPGLVPAGYDGEKYFTERVRLE